MNYSLQKHFEHYDEDATQYMEDVLKIYNDKLLSRDAGLLVKARILTVLLHRLDRDRFKSLYELIDLPELVKACEILDSVRLSRQLRGKLERSPNSKKIQQRYRVASELLLSESVDGLTFGLSKVKMVKGWVRSLPPSKLEYRAMLFPTLLWRKLADLTHLNPEKDFQLGWFLRYCYGEPAPEGTIVNAYHSLSHSNFVDTYKKFNFDYEVIRLKINMNASNQYMDQIKIDIVNREDLKIILWYWHELVTEKNIGDVINKIKESKDVDLSYGKIVDIISKTDNQEVLKELIRIGEEKLSHYSTNIDQPVAVFGDASYSMEIAIKTSGIITSLLCCLCNASLHLFESKDHHYDNPPRTIQDAVKFGKTMKTMGCTAPASSLYHYYEKKQEIKTFIIITDEEENTSSHNYRFTQLYLKYIEEVYPAKLVFISFSDPNKDAYMCRELRNRLEENFDDMIKVFKFSVKNPDLNRMDIVLKYLSE